MLWLLWLWFANVSLAAPAASLEYSLGTNVDDDDAPMLLLPLRLGPVDDVRIVLSAKDDCFSCLRAFWALMPSRILLAVTMDMPQKSGTRCTQAAWHVRLHSEHLRLFFLPNGSI